MKLRINKMAKEYKANVDGREIIYLFKSSEDSVFQ